ncbi:ABC1 kinase family protein [Brachybacterium sp. AOP25-B2-12]|uniref:ABC1 kinase family protein n=1 Tax=Brachybacterium sp. AOP25-B2-12 TaxID=3457710 RepID=UPI004033B3BF
MVVRQSERYRQIAEVLVRFGWGTLAGEVGLRARVPGLGSHHRHHEAVPGPVRLRQALEELGPTFIKLGQMLATREDLLPPAYAHELSRLQDGTDPVPAEQIVAVIREELGKDVDELYASFDRTPLATASIGQTHRARLHDGTEVVVKVRKPGIVPEVYADLAILRDLSSVAAKESRLAAELDVTDLVASFDASLRRELDLTVEAQNAQRFAKDLADDPVVRIPAVHPELSSPAVLTEEFAAGIRITDTKALDAAGLDRPALARAASRTVVRMVLIDGFFHADPHPGNMFVREDGGIWLIDFGMVGELSDDARGDILRLVIALGRKDPDAVTRALLRLAPPRGQVDHRVLRGDVSRLMETISGKLAEMSMLDFFSQLTGMLRRHHLQLPAEISTLLRMLVLTESSAIVLDPDFHLGEVVGEVSRTAILEAWSPRALAGHLLGEGERKARLLADLPDRLLGILDDYEARGVEARLHPEDLEPLVERVESTGDRVIAGITMSALLVGIATVLAGTDGRVGKLRDPLMLLAGTATGVLGVGLVAKAGPARSLVRAVRRLAG